jgi:hypothetical protein
MEANMADTPFIPSDINVTDASDGSSLSTGDLRRGYNFGKEISALRVPRDPLFRLLSTKRKKTVPETQFKIIEERPFLHKRYAYVVGWKTWSGTGSVPVTGFTTNSADISTLTPETAGSTFAVKMGTDYNSAGNVQNVFNQTTNAITIGDAGTLPIFFLTGQTIRIPTKSATADVVADDYIECKVLDVRTSGYYAYLGLRVTRPLYLSTNKYLTSFTDATTPISDTYNYGKGVSMNSKAPLETMKTYVVSNAYGFGTGIPDYYNTQPYTTRYGQTQITKHSFGMTNSALATEYLIKANEKERRWGEIMLEHKWDLAHEQYFSQRYTDAEGVQHTQGIVDFALNYGNVFPYATTDTQDTLLDQLSVLYDPRTLEFQDMLFVVPMVTYNWLHKLGGYALNNLKIGYQSYGAHFTYDFAAMGKKYIDGAEIFQFGTLFGPMNVMYDPHLDGTEVNMLGINMNSIAYCILAGNGINRDTTIYPGVQRIETTGVDATVDLIQTEWGMEIILPESFAVWKHA